MHFVATLALRLPIQVLYDLRLTALSWVFAIVACGAAFIVLRRMTGRPREFLIAGALIGIGIASMHYTGDASMRLAPGIRYDPWLFVASILIAIGAATVALWMAFHLAGQRAVFANFGAALVMGAAVVGMHFTAVAAANFHPDSVCLSAGPRLDGEWMAYTIGGFTFDQLRRAERLEELKPGAVARASFDDWQINACPHHGPSLSVGPDGVRHLAWYTGDGKAGGGVFYARAEAGDRSERSGRLIRLRMANLSIPGPRGA